MDPLLGFILFAAIAIAGFVYNHFQNRQRWNFWEKLADDWDYRFRSDDAYHFAEREEFPLFKQGHKRCVDYLIEGTATSGTDFQPSRLSMSWLRNSAAAWV